MMKFCKISRTQNCSWIENKVKFKMQAKHLYHDREEITVHIQSLSNISPLIGVDTPVIKMFLVAFCTAVHENNSNIGVK